MISLNECTGIQNFLKISKYQTLTLLNLELAPGFGGGRGRSPLPPEFVLVTAAPPELLPSKGFEPTSIESNIAFIWATAGDSCTLLFESCAVNCRLTLLDEVLGEPDELDVCLDTCGFDDTTLGELELCDERGTLPLAGISGLDSFFSIEVFALFVDNNGLKDFASESETFLRSPAGDLFLAKGKSSSLPSASILYLALSKIFLRGGSDDFWGGSAKLISVKLGGGGRGGDLGFGSTTDFLESFLSSEENFNLWGWGGREVGRGGAPELSLFLAAWGGTGGVTPLLLFSKLLSLTKAIELLLVVLINTGFDISLSLLLNESFFTMGSCTIADNELFEFCGFAGGLGTGFRAGFGDGLNSVLGGGAGCGFDMSVIFGGGIELLSSVYEAEPLPVNFANNDLAEEVFDCLFVVSWSTGVDMSTDLFLLL